MHSSNEIEEFLSEKGYSFITHVRVRPNDGVVLLYVNREQVAEKVKPGFTSLKQLGIVKTAVGSQFGVSVDVIFSLSESHLELEEAFRRLLNRQFHGKIVSFYISFRTSSIVDTWIELEHSTDDLRTKLIELYESLLRNVQLSSGKIDWINSRVNLPTASFLLRVLKTNQPIDLKSIIEILHQNYEAADEKWISHNLDKLRKKAIIMRTKTGFYALTDKGLALVPTSKRSSSSDVERALALGRRKW